MRTADRRRGLFVGLALTAFGCVAIAGYYFRKNLFSHPLVESSVYADRPLIWDALSPVPVVGLAVGCVLVPVGLYRIAESLSNRSDRLPRHDPATRVTSSQE